MTVENPDPYRWTMLLVSWLITFTAALCINCYSPLLNEMRESLSMSYSEAALPMSLAILTSSSFQVVAGVLTTRIGTRKTLLIGSTVIATSQLLAAMASTFALEAASRLFVGLGAGMTLLCAVGLLAVWFPPRELARVMGIQATGWAVGSVVGFLTPLPLEAAFMMDWRGPFLIFGVLAVAVTLILLVLAKEKSSTQVPERSERPSLAELAKIKELWTVTIGQFGAMAAITIFMTWLPAILIESGWLPTVAATISTMLPLVGVIGNLAGGALSDRLGRRKPIILITGILGALSYALFIFVIQTPIVWIVAAATGWFMYFYIGPLLSVLPGIPEIGPSRSGAAWGMVMTVCSVAGFISPILMGQIRMVTGSYTLGFVVAAAFGAMLVVPGVFGRETGRKG